MINGFFKDENRPVISVFVFYNKKGKHTKDA